MTGLRRRTLMGTSLRIRRRHLKTLAGALVSRYDILKRPKALPTGRGARIAYTRMHSGEAVTLTLTANSRDSWRGYDRYGLTLALPPDYLIDNPARWEVVKD